MTKWHSRFGKWPSSLVVVVGLTVILVAPGSAEANPTPLSAMVLTNVLPGFIAAVPGATNGPITAANIGLLTAGSDPAIEQRLADGDLEGYVRVWTQQPPDEDAVIIEVFRLSQDSEVYPFLSGLNAGVEHDSGPSDFNVPGIGGALGFTVQPSSSSHFLTEYAVTFGKGNTVIVVAVATATGSLTSADAVQIATKQAGEISGTPPEANSFGAYQLGEIFGSALFVVLVVGLVFWMIQRSRRTTKALAATSPGKYPPPPVSGPAEPGWYALGDNPNEQAYWDGAAWTGRRLWTGSHWV